LSKVISKDALGELSYEAWQVPEVQGVLVGRKPEEEEAHRTRTALTAQQLEEIQEQARKEAFEQGYQDGLRAGAEEIRARVQRLEQLLGTLARPFEELDAAVEQQLCRLAMLVAGHLVRRELKTDPGQVIATVREGLAALPVSSRDIRVLLHPEDAQLVRDAFALSEGDGRIEIVDDPVQSRGGCRIQTEFSQIDATVETRLNAIIAQVLGGERDGDESE
jgi:flagellar assembly protein FliH